MAEALLDDLPALLCFARVVELGSFTAAARTLGVSKSVISTRVAALEARLGEQLLLRTTRKISTTEAGLRTYALARQMVEAATAATSDASEAGHGVLRVSAPTSLGQQHLAAPLAAFARRSPGTRVELLLDDHLVDLVEERIDLAVRVTKPQDSSLVARRVGWTAIQVCAAPAYLAARGRPERPEDLLRHDCLRYSLLRAAHEWRLYGPNGRIPIAVRGTFESNSGLMLREMAIVGMGLAMLPRFMVADAIEAGTLETVLDDFAPRPMGIYAVRSGRGATPRLIAALIEELERALRGPRWRA